ncbi:hypothetical protein RHGRI_033009 [Rhododendron griersonianum]|uniref:Uncharacterized protein n=1 Tax=Rhododendron griersonianum TaxID=479676 RepID=A0AAV6I0N4_9ERIC|nr:hypothetical protein RHGRI_033009 [Rhododendron griersonianum]
MEEESEPIFDKESGGILEKEVCIPNFNAKCLPIWHVMVTKEDIGNVWDDEGCGKNDMMTIVECFKPPIYDEYPEYDVELEELKLLTARNATQLRPSSPTVNSNKRKVDDWDWLDESVLKQHTGIFETYEVIRGSECSFVMDSGSADSRAEFCLGSTHQNSLSRGRAAQLTREITSATTHRGRKLAATRSTVYPLKASHVGELQNLDGRRAVRVKLSHGDYSEENPPGETV